MPHLRPQIIGYDKRDRPIWLVQGGADDGAGDSGGNDSKTGGDGAKPADGTGKDGKTGGADDLGDAGKRALTAERDARRTAERERDELQKRIDAVEDANRTDGEKALRRAEKAEGDLTRTTAERDRAQDRVARLEAVIAARLGAEESGKLTKAADRLVGKTPEEYATDATELLAGFGSAAGANGSTGGRPKPDPSQGRTGTGGATENVRPGAGRLRAYHEQQEATRSRT